MNDLLELLQRHFGIAAPIAQAWALTFLRIGSAMAVLPGLAEQSIPARIRLGLALLLSLSLLPATLPMAGNMQLSSAFASEMIVGLILGLGVRFFVFALSIAGTIIANATSLSQLFAPGAEAQPAIAQLLTFAGIAIAFQLGLLTKIVGVFLLSYQALPIGYLPDSSTVAEWAVRHTGMVFSLGFKIALPFAIASLLYNLALGVINRAMPQLMVTFIGAPALSLGGLALMAVGFPTALTVWLVAFHSFIDSPLGW